MHLLENSPSFQQDYLIYINVIVPCLLSREWSMTLQPLWPAFLQDSFNMLLELVVNWHKKTTMMFRQYVTLNKWLYHLFERHILQ